MRSLAGLLVVVTALLLALDDAGAAEVANQGYGYGAGAQGYGYGGTQAPAYGGYAAGYGGYAEQATGAKAQVRLTF